MAKSVRISDSLYNDAEATAQKMHRSLAQQVEHWASIGRTVEDSGVTAAQMIAILNGDLRAIERAMLKMGMINPESVYLFPSRLVAATKVRFPELEE